MVIIAQTCALTSDCVFYEEARDMGASIPLCNLYDTDPDFHPNCHLCSCFMNKEKALKLLRTLVSYDIDN